MESGLLRLRTGVDHLEEDRSRHAEIDSAVFVQAMPYSAHIISLKSPFADVRSHL